MRLSPIHQSPEQQLATSSQGVLSVAQEQKQKMEDMAKAIENLGETAKDKSEEARGFQSVVENLQATNKSITELKDYVDHPEVVVRKLEEVKSASLITNKLLKKISENKAPETKFPETQKISIEGVKVITVKGDDGKTPTPEQLKALIKPLIPPPVHGKDYVLTAKDKKDIARSIDVPIVEKVIQKTEVIRERPIVTNEIREVAVGDEPDEVIAKINQSKKRIDAKRVGGLEEVIQLAQEFGSNPQGQYVNVGGANPLILLSNGVRVTDYVTEINFSTNITPVYSGNGRVTLTASGGGGTTYTETPSGTIDGVNKAFTTLNTITTVINFAIGGTFIHPAEYSFSGSTITFVTAPNASLSGLSFTVIYQ